LDIVKVRNLFIPIVVIDLSCGKCFDPICTEPVVQHRVDVAHNPMLFRLFDSCNEFFLCAPVGAPSALLVELSKIVCCGKNN
jgi:hypothetical protein